MILRKIFFVFIICIFFTSCERSNKENIDENASADIVESITQGDKINFSLTLMNDENLFIKAEGEKLSFSVENKAVLFVFFTTWCTPCLAEIPSLNRLWEKYNDSIEIIGVLLEDKTREDLEEFVRKNNLKFKVAIGENNYLLSKVIGGVNGIPTLYLYNKNGRLLNQYLGLIPEEMLEIDIQKAIK